MKKCIKILSLILATVMLVTTSIPAFAVSQERKLDNPFISTDSEYYLTPEEIENSGLFSKEELEQSTANGEVILGGINAPLQNAYSASIPGTASPQVEVLAGQAWITSYATYDSSKGIQVYVKLYVPWYYFTNPKFTSMSGSVVVKINSKNTTKWFSKTAKEASTIDKTVSTGVTASSGTKGTVTVSGTATGTNVASGAGAFYSSYSVTIP